MPPALSFSKIQRIQKINVNVKQRQNQPPEVFCKKRCSQKFRKIPWNISVPESFFQYNCRLPATLIKKRLWDRCFPVNFAKFLRTTMAYYINIIFTFTDRVGHGRPFCTEQLRTTASEHCDIIVTIEQLLKNSINNRMTVQIFIKICLLLDIQENQIF